ncbi:DUF1878 family protein [Virgibacillus sp. 179-BFC.A HS]|uniref:DUF1878 family protein n=1 Tax=Tigheibacillus jepli TaxID=3035914 RepID=A0ABU5CKA2_9BACI|nr:DUF1878 family protein [Virgibacillus sp. 179-BFC.A HS]MDY0406244.1 DUF1878 family protein [Virgibacillus sp. 179-BFC.A HS]
MLKENDVNQTAFHIRLLLNILDVTQYPFTKMIIEHNIGKTTYEDFLLFLEKLDGEYRSQKREGLLDFSSLLTIFSEKLPRGLTTAETVQALYHESYYPELMKEFITLMENGENRKSRRIRKRKR